MNIEPPDAYTRARAQLVARLQKEPEAPAANETDLPSVDVNDLDQRLQEELGSALGARGDIDEDRGEESNGEDDDTST